MEINRNVGIDVAKILSMILITCIHYLAYTGGWEDKEQISEINYVFLVGLNTLTKMATNMFVIITGYFMIDKIAKPSKLFKLWGEVLFTSILVLLFCCLVWKNIRLVAVVRCIFPYLTVHYWFFISYSLLYVLIPAINFVLAKLEENNTIFRKLVLFFGWILTVFMPINPFPLGESFVGGVRGIVWFIYLYIVGAYIKHHQLMISRKVWGSIGLLCFICLFVLKYYNITFPGRIYIDVDNSLLPFLMTLSAFMVVKDLKFNSDKGVKYIGEMAQCSFFVYIIQENDAFRGNYWTLFNVERYLDSGCMFIQFIIAILLLWPIAWLINKLYEIVYDNYIKKFGIYLDERLAYYKVFM